MTFRTRLLLAFAIAVGVSVALVSIIVAETTGVAFARLDEQRTAALVAQFRREFARRADDVVRRIDRIASSEAVERLAVEISRPEPDYSVYLEEARMLAGAQALNLLELTAQDGTIISSAQWPARFGYKDEWVVRTGDTLPRTAALKREDLPDEAAVLALAAVRIVPAGEKKLYLAGGERLDKDFLGSLALSEGMRVLLYFDGILSDATGATLSSSPFAALLAIVKREKRETSRIIELESVQAIPLPGADKDLLGVLLVASSRRDLAALQKLIRTLGLSVGSAGVLVGLLLAWWATARVTRPVHQLAAAAREVAHGNWNTHVPPGSRDEIGDLARAFNEMTRQLLDQREKLVQSERVAAWRELARRLAHELKNPLFPLQITVENMQRARSQYPEQFDEVFREGTSTLLAELTNLKTIIGRFSDFARMPPPDRNPMDLNAAVREVTQLFRAQFLSAGVKLEEYLEETLPFINADAGQWSRALRNIVLNAMDAMPAGGVLKIRTEAHDGLVRLEIADTGSGLTKEECERLFTPYYTTKQHGTGLGLAIVQSVVSDHGGRISVESEVGKGTRFRVELNVA
ncbi:MAG: ATP-binding protein [Bryobacteraceae bacterium]